MTVLILQGVSNVNAMDVTLCESLPSRGDKSEIDNGFGQMKQDRLIFNNYWTRLASRSIICRSPRLRQIIDLRDTDKSRYFAITEFNNCFIIQSSSLFSIFGGSGKRALLAEINWFPSQLDNLFCRLQILENVWKRENVFIYELVLTQSLKVHSKSWKCSCKNY